MLILATVCWSLSFLAMKALVMTQQKLVPNASTMFFASLSVMVRFGVSAFVLLFFCLPTWRQFTKKEIVQGLGLGIIGGIGLLLQMDGVNYTAASTSAFLTQCYCIFIPLFVVLREQRWPSPIIFISSIMVLGGIAILAKFDWKEMRLGRGEWETILATLFFTGQILWLERPTFAKNKPNHFSLVMFASMTLILLPVPIFSDSTWNDALHAYSSFPALFFAGILTVFCTLGGYVIMNFWQPHIEASKAGLIYCAEPVFASLFALFLPELFSRIANIDYPNETWTTHLLTGGGLITGANILIMIQTARAAKQSSAKT